MIYEWRGRYKSYQNTGNFMMFYKTEETTGSVIPTHEVAKGEQNVNFTFGNQISESKFKSDCYSAEEVLYLELQNRMPRVQPTQNPGQLSAAHEIKSSMSERNRLANQIINIFELYPINIKTNRRVLRNLVLQNSNNIDDLIKQLNIVSSMDMPKFEQGINIASKSVCDIDFDSLEKYLAGRSTNEIIKLALEYHEMYNNNTNVEQAWFNISHEHSIADSSKEFIGNSIDQISKLATELRTNISMFTTGSANILKIMTCLILVLIIVNSRIGNQVKQLLTFVFSFITGTDTGVKDDELPLVEQSGESEWFNFAAIVRWIGSNIIQWPADGVTKLLITVWNSKHTDQVMKRIGYFGDNKLDKGIKNIIVFMKRIIHRIRLVFCQILGIPYEPKEFLSIVEEFESDVTMIMQRDVNCELDHNSRDEYNRIKTLYGNVLAYTKRSEYKEYELIFNEWAQLLDKIMQKFPHHKVSVTTKVPPVMFSLYGKPGQGKSTILAPLMEATLELDCLVKHGEDSYLYKDFQKNIGNKIYARDPTQKFYDGWNDPLAIVIDDAFQVKDNETRPDPVLMEIVESNNTVSKPINMAGVEDKGRHFNNAKIIGLSHNMVYPKITSVVEPEAIYRRLENSYVVIRTKDANNFQSEQMDVDSLRFYKYSMLGIFKSRQNQVADTVIDEEMPITIEEIAENVTSRAQAEWAEKGMTWLQVVTDLYKMLNKKGSFADSLQKQKKEVMRPKIKDLALRLKLEQSNNGEQDLDYETIERPLSASDLYALLEDDLGCLDDEGDEYLTFGGETFELAQYRLDFQSMDIVQRKRLCQNQQVVQLIKIHPEAKITNILKRTVRPIFEWCDKTGEFIRTRWYGVKDEVSSRVAALEISKQYEQLSQKYLAPARSYVNVGLERVEYSKDKAKEIFSAARDSNAMKIVMDKVSRVRERLCKQMMDIESKFHFLSMLSANINIVLICIGVSGALLSTFYFASTIKNNAIKLTGNFFKKADSGECELSLGEEITKEIESYDLVNKVVPSKRIESQYQTETKVNNQRKIESQYVVDTKVNAAKKIESQYVVDTKVNAAKKIEGYSLDDKVSQLKRIECCKNCEPAPPQNIQIDKNRLCETEFCGSLDILKVIKTNKLKAAEIVHICKTNQSGFIHPYKTTMPSGFEAFIRIDKDGLLTIEYILTEEFKNIWKNIELRSVKQTESAEENCARKECIDLLEREISEGKMMREQGIYDVSSVEQMRSVMKRNQYLIVPCVHSQVHDRAIGMITIVKGNIGMMPEHFIPYFERYMKADENATIFLKNELLKRSFEIPIKDFIKEIKVVKVTDNTIRNLKRDLCFVQLKSIIPHKDITQYFSTREQLSQVRITKAVLATMHLAKDNLNGWAECETRYCSANSMLTCRKLTEYTNGMTGEDMIISVVRDCYQYDIDTVAGDCGSLLFARNNAITGKIIGMHVAGDRVSGNSCPVYADDMENLDNMFGFTISQKYVTLDESKMRTYQQGDIPSEAELERIGSLKTPIRQPAKTKIEPSMLHNTYAAPKTAICALKTTKLDNGQTHNPRGYRLGRAGNICVPQDHCMIENSRDACIDFMSEVLKPAADRRTQGIKAVYTFEEAVTGIHGEPYVNSIKRGTSPGYPFIHTEGMKTKKEIFGSETEFDMTRWQARKLKERVEYIISEAVEGRALDHYFNDSLKDERKAAKKAYKTRLFAAGPIDYLIACKMYFNGIVALLQEKRNHCGVSVGTNCYSQDWDDIVQVLQRKSTNMIAGDFEGFDASQHLQLLREASEVLIQLSKRFLGSTETDIRVMRVLMAGLYSSHHINGHEVYRATHSLPSGHYLTAIINSIFVNVAFGCVFQIAMNDVSYRTARTFWERCGIVTYGDDHIVSVPCDLLDRFNQINMPQLMAIIGLGYTLESKDGEAETQSRNIEEISYLKRGFIFDEDAQRYRGPIAIDTILDMPQWIHKSPDPITQAKLNVDQALKELSLHTETTWNDWYPKISSAAQEHLGHFTRYTRQNETKQLVMDTLDSNAIYCTTESNEISFMNQEDEFY